MWKCFYDVEIGHLFIYGEDCFEKINEDQGRSVIFNFWVKDFPANSQVFVQNKLIEIEE